MMKRRMEAGSASIKALAIVVALGAAAHAAIPYLPQVGPPPLRIQVVQSPATPLMARLETTNTPSITATNVAATIETNISKTVASLVSTNNGSPTEITSVSTAQPLPESSPGDALTTSIFALPTPDLLGITPQNLATYFRPVQFGTNSTPVLVPFSLSFMPPFPPDKSSHAEYIIK